jgi:hypothetical protein
MLPGLESAVAIASISIIAAPDAARIPHCKSRKLVSFFSALSISLVLATAAWAETLVVLLEGLGGRTTSQGIVSLEMRAIANTRVPFPLSQHNWRDAVKLIQQQTPETKIVVIGYSLGANNSTYVAKNVNHVDELIAIEASVWGRSTPIGENVDRAIEIYNLKFWRTAGLGAERLLGVHFCYITNSDSHFYADNDPQVHKFIFTEVQKIADPTTSARSVSGIQPAGTVGAQDMQKVKAAITLLKSESSQSARGQIVGFRVHS